MKLHQLIETSVDDEDDDHDDGSYEREKKVSLLILRAFRKCGIPVAEADQHRGVRDQGDSWGYDIIYTEDDHEATVSVEEIELAHLVKLHESGLIEGKCEIIATRDGALRFTFKVHSALHSGDASID